ncbi:universal stress protein [Salinibacter sp. 10B]|uniref:universal stress protein n=1 Tax=Salinibacter sp. 10B TaxID=1923971 RepID=UPI000CF55079|nr:universal stress protein [Salinibacter sp. 10B]PQJ34330.1 universal stress protein [Salinibacter sp. 10B]
MLNIQRVLFPTDFSDGSKRAFPQAAFLADWHDAELHILNVTGRHRHDYKETKKNFPISPDTLTEWLRRPAQSVEGTTWPDLEALPIEQSQIEASTPAESIVTYADDKNIDLVVMGTHGRRGVDRMLFGSVTEEVVRRAPCPVFTVRADADKTPGQAVRRVLVPIDFSDASESAVQHAKEIALTYGAEIDLLHVVEPPFYPSAYGIDTTTFPTQEVVDRVEKQLGDMAREEIGYEHVMVSATVGHPPSEILNYVDENEVDLVVIATHGRTGLERALLGSVTERVLRRSPAPAFVVKPTRKSLLPSAKTAATQET